VPSAKINVGVLLTLVPELTMQIEMCNFFTSDTKLEIIPTFVWPSRGLGSREASQSAIT